MEANSIINIRIIRLELCITCYLYSKKMCKYVYTRCKMLTTFYVHIKFTKKLSCDITWDTNHTQTHTKVIGNNIYIYLYVYIYNI